MYKNSVAILFFSLFIITQYGRQLAYIECRIEVKTGSSNKTTCDCEKNKDNDLNRTGSVLPPLKSHSHISLDEYYVLNENISSSCIKKIIVEYSKAQATFLSNYQGNIFHPPQL